jgi:hypothetical protein
MPPPLVKFASFSAPLGFEELARGLLKEVISADATMQLYQCLAWQEVGRGSEPLEGAERLHNLGLKQVRFTFHLEPVGASWPARTWGVLTEPLGTGWLSRVAQLLAAPPRSFRIAPGPTEGGVAVSIIVGRESNGEWQVRQEPEAPLTTLEH